MPKQKTQYICQNCEFKSPHWMGQCSSCGEWNTMVETIIPQAGRGARSVGAHHDAPVTKPVKLSQIKSKEIQRISSNIKEFDRVLGGGFVQGQVILLAGTPGVGKSTLLTQIGKALPKANVLYVCGEESVGQVKVRAERMGYKSDNLHLLSETNVDAIVDFLSSSNETSLLIVDSIQTLFSQDLTGMAGSVGQVRGSSSKLIDIAKAKNIPTILVGHVTKEGTVAGPKVLEHMVDTVLYLEGDSNHMFRILKTTKNRFGPVSEVGIFEMTEGGMQEVDNPSKLFLNEDDVKSSGTCLTVVMEGYRPMILEIQALTVRTSFGYPKRTASGYSINRLHVLIATIEKRCGIKLSDYDVYLNVSGGYKITEQSCDLAVCLAIISSVKDKALKEKTIAFGECDLSGGVRKVPFFTNRTKESKNLGFTNIISAPSIKTINQAMKKAF